jgi:hypothetical protein
VSDLFNRDLTLNVGGIEIRIRDPNSSEARPTLRVSFEVKASRQSYNTCQLTIYNLNEQRRAQLQEKNVQTSLLAGYIDNTSQIFSGELQRASSIHDGTDWITTIRSGDGVRQSKSARMSKSFQGPIDPGKVLEAVAKELGVGLGNVKQKAAENGIRAALKEFSNGFVAHGKVEKVLRRVTKSMGYSYSIQDGQIVLLGPNETVPGTAVLLSAATGLIGSPEPGEKGITKARSLLLPDMLPGRKVKIESGSINGFFRVEKVTMTGDTWETDWYSETELKPL